MNITEMMAQIAALKNFQGNGQEMDIPSQTTDTDSISQWIQQQPQNNNASAPSASQDGSVFQGNNMIAPPKKQHGGFGNIMGMFKGGK